MTRTELVEKMARAIWPNCTAAWHDCHTMPFCICKKKATAALAAIEAAGWVCVPREATKEMIDAAGRVLVFGVVSDAAFCAAEYRAILAASPLAKEPGA